MTRGYRLTEDQINRVAAALQTTPSWRAAADYAGIHEDTIHLYRRLAQNYTKRHGEDQDVQDETDIDWWQWQAVQIWNAARNRLELTCAKGILDAGPKDWKAYQAILKSGWPSDYSDRIELRAGPLELSAEERAEQLVELALSYRESVEVGAEKKPRQRKRSAVGLVVPEVERGPDESGPAR